MNTIRIGTRDSELALWQAKTVQNQLKTLGYPTEIVSLAQWRNRYCRT